jgi:NAD(P)H-hydrate epimerase
MEVRAVDLPTLSVAQMREVDRIMIEELGIDLLQMMENAGRALAQEVRRVIGGNAAGRRVVVLAGPGGNGGGGLAAARWLCVWGAEVGVVLAQPEAAMAAVPVHQLSTLMKLGTAIFDSNTELGSLLSKADAVVDALIGYSLKGAPREPMAGLIRTANGCGRPLIALDLPSGLDGDSGLPNEPTIRAMTTLTLALPKTGLIRPEAAAWVGELRLADISVPGSVYSQLGLEVGAVFAECDVLRISR